MAEHLNRHHIVAAIDSERDHQDKLHGDDSPSLTKILDLMDKHIKKARKGLKGDTLEVPMSEIRQAVSIGVLGMELYGAPQRNATSTVMEDES